MKLNPCSACSVRYDKSDSTTLNNCCFQTCAQFVSGTYKDIIKSNCGKQCIKCVKSKNIPKIINTPQHFKECLNKDSNPLSCCLKKAKNYEEQERCIDAFNALVDVREDYLFMKRLDRGLLFLGFVCLFAYARQKINLNSVMIEILLYSIMYFILF